MRETNPLTDYPGWNKKSQEQKYQTIDWKQLKSLLKTSTKNIRAEDKIFIRPWVSILGLIILYSLYRWGTLPCYW